MWHAWGRVVVVHAGFWWGNVRGNRVLGRPRHRWDNNVKMDPY